MAEPKGKAALEEVLRADFGFRRARLGVVPDKPPCYCPPPLAPAASSTEVCRAVWTVCQANAKADEALQRDSRALWWVSETDAAGSAQ